MVNTKRFGKQLDRNAKNRNVKVSKTKSKKSKSPTAFTADQVLSNDYERLQQYVPVKFRGDEIPLTEKELRDYVKQELSKDTSLRFLTDEVVRDSSYDKLVRSIFESKRYQEGLKSVETFINVKGKTREGVRLKDNERYYFKVIIPNRKKGKVIQRPYKRYYSIKTGKQVPSDKIDSLEVLSERATKKVEKKSRVEEIKKT